MLLRGGSTEQPSGRIDCSNSGPALALGLRNQDADFQSKLIQASEPYSGSEWCNVVHSYWSKRSCVAWAAVLIWIDPRSLGEIEMREPETLN